MTVVHCLSYTLGAILKASTTSNAAWIWPRASTGQSHIHAFAQGRRQPCLWVIQLYTHCIAGTDSSSLPGPNWQGSNYVPYGTFVRAWGKCIGLYRPNGCPGLHLQKHLDIVFLYLFRKGKNSSYPSQLLGGVAFSVTVCYICRQPVPFIPYLTG